MDRFFNRIPLVSSLCRLGSLSGGRPAVSWGVDQQLLVHGQTLTALGCSFGQRIQAGTPGGQLWTASNLQTFEILWSFILVSIGIMGYHKPPGFSPYFQDRKSCCLAVAKIGGSVQSCGSETLWYCFWHQISFDVFIKLTTRELFTLFFFCIFNIDRLIPCDRCDCILWSAELCFCLAWFFANLGLNQRKWSAVGSSICDSYHFHSFPE